METRFLSQCTRTSRDGWERLSDRFFGQYPCWLGADLAAWMLELKHVAWNWIPFTLPGKQTWEMLQVTGPNGEPISLFVPLGGRWHTALNRSLARVVQTLEPWPLPSPTCIFFMQADLGIFVNHDIAVFTVIGACSLLETASCNWGDVFNQVWLKVPEFWFAATILCGFLPKRLQVVEVDQYRKHDWVGTLGSTSISAISVITSRDLGLHHLCDDAEWWMTPFRFY